MNTDNYDYAEVEDEDLDEMPLLMHLQELRKRLIISAIAMCIGFFIALPFYNYIMDFLMQPLM